MDPLYPSFAFKLAVLPSSHMVKSILFGSYYILNMEIAFQFTAQHYECCHGVDCTCGIWQTERLKNVFTCLYERINLKKRTKPLLNLSIRAPLPCTSLFQIKIVYTIHICIEVLLKIKTLENRKATTKNKCNFIFSTMEKVCRVHP